jgi:hypothetical protein|tara:strand:+ start:238 stop:405 length:168 start_codon:yes stop_codon:yes gene_type:complete
MKISEVIIETTSAGAIATVAQPMGKMIKRPNPSIYSTAIKKKSKKKKAKKQNESS